jgi:hypothetical protein
MAQAQPVAAPAPASARPNLLALFWGVIVRPRATFAYLRDFGGASWLAPAVLAGVVLVASVAVVAPLTRQLAQAETEAMRERLGDTLSPEEQAQMDQITALAANPLFTVVMPAVTGVITLAVGWLFRGGLLYLFALLLGGKPRFAAMFRMTVWSALPDVVRQLVTTLGTLASGRVLTAGLAFLVAAPEPGTIPSVGAALSRAFLSGLDIYWLWGLALLSIGVAVTAGFSLRKGLLAAAGQWLVGLLLTLGWLWLSLSLAAQAGVMTG